MKTITIVGASLAGLYAARELRAQGFDGRLVIVGEERHRPYDRPPLSKQFLTGAVTREQLTLTDDDDETDLAAEWMLGARASGLDPWERAVRLEDGRSLSTEGLVIATGAAARRMPGGDMPGVHTLRTVDDAQALRADLRRGRARVVVIGGGFIGAEVASSCATMGHEVTVIEAAPLPLVPQLGEEMARACATLHKDHGVTLLCGTGVAALRGGADGRVGGVELQDGRVRPADVVVAGIGARPNTGWLEGSGLALRDGVVCDAGGATGMPGVVAVGDVARCGDHRSEHWTSATQQPATAVRNLLAGATVEEHRALPYFWSDQYGVRVQFAGRRGEGDTVRVAEGSSDDRSFLAVYENEGRTTAVLAFNRPRPFARMRREMSRASQPVAL
ncbi:NAD(P)/FAD-dependent oxidoreductase [Streptomyces sp. NPDC054796]